MWIGNVRFEGRIAIFLKRGGGWPPLSVRGFQILKNSCTGKRRQKHPVFVNTLDVTLFIGRGWNIWIERCWFRCSFGQIGDDLTKPLHQKKRDTFMVQMSRFLMCRRLVRSSSIWPILHRNKHLSIQMFTETFSRLPENVSPRHLDPDHSNRYNWVKKC